MPGTRRSRSCMPQKQPPARCASSLPLPPGSFAAVIVVSQPLTTTASTRPRRSPYFTRGPHRAHARTEMGHRPLAIQSPIDGAVHLTAELLDLASANEKLAASKQASRAVRELRVKERVAICLRFLDQYLAHLDENATDITLMMGKPIAQAKGEFGGMKAR